MNELDFNNQKYVLQVIGENYPLSLMIKPANSSNENAYLAMFSFDFIEDCFTVTGMVHCSLCKDEEKLQNLIDLIQNQVLKDSNKAKVAVQIISPSSS